MKYALFALGLMVTPGLAQDTVPQAPWIPPIERADSQIAERPSSVIPSTANITVEQLYTLINERDRQYQQRFEAQEKAVNSALIAAKEAVNAALASSKEAVNKADAADEKRFDSVNEFRAQQKDLISTFMSRAETEARLKNIESEAARMNNVIVTWLGRADGANWIWIALGAVAGALLAIGGFLLKAIDTFKRLPK